MSDREKLLTIIAYAYQIAGAHDAPEHILDVLSDPEAATDEQVEAMLPYTPALSIDVEKLARAMCTVFCEPLEAVEIYRLRDAKAIIEELKK